MNEIKQMQVAVFCGAARDLRYLGFDHRVSVVTDALVTQCQLVHDRLQIKIEREQGFQVGQIGFDLRWLGGLKWLLQQGERVTPAFVGVGTGFFFQKRIEPIALRLGKMGIDNLPQFSLVTGDCRDDQARQNSLAGQRDFLGGQQLDDFQKNQLGPDLNAHHQRDFIGG